MDDIYIVEAYTAGDTVCLYVDKKLPENIVGSQGGLDIIKRDTDKSMTVSSDSFRRLGIKVGSQLMIRPISLLGKLKRQAVLCKGCGLKEWYEPSDTIKMCSKCGGDEFVLESDINRGFRKVVEQNIQGAMSYVAEAGKFFGEDKALRYNEGKTRWSLVHFPSLEPMVEVLEFGAKKYEERNWMKPMDKKQILNSMMRHLVRLMEDEELDSESNLKHIGHIMCNAMFYSYHSTLGK